VTGLRYGLLILSLLVALEHGVSTFISIGYDPASMQHSPSSAPELRNRVASVRA
jgi:hypothetical protein